MRILPEMIVVPAGQFIMAPARTSPGTHQLSPRAQIYSCRPLLSKRYCSIGVPGRDMSARRGPLVVPLKLQTELVVGNAQIAVAAAQYRRGHDCLPLLRHHADIGLVAAVVAEAIGAEADI